jgi:hypothetical protein
MEPNWVHSALRPPVGLLCQTRVIMMMEKLVEWWFGKGNRSTRRKPAPMPLCPPQIIHANPDRCGGKQATKRLSYGTAIQPVASRYTDYAIPALFCYSLQFIEVSKFNSSNDIIQIASSSCMHSRLWISAALTLSHFRDIDFSEMKVLHFVCFSSIANAQTNSKLRIYRTWRISVIHVVILYSPFLLAYL